VTAPVRCFVCAGLFAFGASLASAQSQVDIGVGFGAAFDKSTGQGIDNLNSPTNAFGPCTPGSGDTYCQPTASLNAFFLGIGGDILFTKHFGFGANFDVQPATKSYGPLTERQMFYDFNAVYQPYSSKRAQFRLLGGVGGARTSFGFSQSGCVGNNIACSSQNEPVGTDNHFDVHVGAGVQLYVTDRIFVRPEFDLHYAPGLHNDFSSNAVPEFIVYVGFSGGGR